MIVNNCPAHPEISGLKAINLRFLPTNASSCKQPMDQGQSDMFALLVSSFINKVNRIAIECLDLLEKVFIV